ncbi:MAG: redoxin domain-containing protein, partial [Fuerstiella sp.]|nr:redoxin domain-containing protein [Fuerstiella sp.]
MKKRMNLLMPALCASVFATLASPVLSAEPESDMIGRRIPDFLLPDAAGKKFALSDFNDSKALIVVFLGTQCPIGNAYVPVLGDLQKKYKDHGLQVVAVNSNLADDADSVAEHVKEFKVAFPVLVDSRQVVADIFEAQRTPEAYVLDRRRHIRYRGRIDDRFGYTYKREKARRNDLEEA